MYGGGASSIGGGSSEVCLECHLPFSDVRHTNGGSSEVRMYQNGIGPYHAQCLSKQSEPSIADVMRELRELKTMVEDLRKSSRN